MAFLQANVHFQAALHQAKAWKTSSQLNKRSLFKAEAKIEKLEAELAEKQKELEEAQARNVELLDEKRMPLTGIWILKISRIL